MTTAGFTRQLPSSPGSERRPRARARKLNLSRLARGRADASKSSRARIRHDAETHVDHGIERCGGINRLGNFVHSGGVPVQFATSLGAVARGLELDRTKGSVPLNARFGPAMDRPIACNMAGEATLTVKRI